MPVPVEIPGPLKYGDKSNMLRSGVVIRPIKGFTPTDTQAVKMAASVMSAILKGVDPIPNMSSMPSSFMGSQVAIDWTLGTADDNQFKLTAGNISITHDADNVLDFATQLIDAGNLSDAQAVAADKAWLTDSLVAGTNTGLDNVKDNLNFPTTGDNGSSISWDASAHSQVNDAGVVTQAFSGEPDISANIVATISKGSESDTKTFNVTVQDGGAGLN